VSGRVHTATLRMNLCRSQKAAEKVCPAIGQFQVQVATQQRHTLARATMRYCGYLHEINYHQETENIITWGLALVDVVHAIDRRQVREPRSRSTEADREIASVTTQGPGVETKQLDGAGEKVRPVVRRLSR
jgi:hypothetical protein